MAGRVIATLMLIATLALIYLAPQGLLTKPQLEEGLRGPFQLRDLEPLDEKLAYQRAYDLGLQDTTIETGWSPAILNEQLVSATEQIEFGYVSESNDAELFMNTNVETSVTQLPRGSYLIASFPNRGMFSARLGAWKVLRGFQHEVMKRNLRLGPILEIHAIGSEEIHYLMAIQERPTVE
jgi:hypothetical protein